MNKEFYKGILVGLMLCTIACIFSLMWLSIMVNAYNNFGARLGECMELNTK